MQIVSLGDNWLEMSKPVFLEKLRKSQIISEDTHTHEAQLSRDTRWKWE